MKQRFRLFVLIVLTCIYASPIFAITDGDLDGDQHPAVVLIVMDGFYGPASRCSGTLISPTYVLTAGHCTGAPGQFTRMRVFTESDVQNGNNNYPFAGLNSVEAVSWASHPDYPNEPFYFNDVGVIELAEPVLLPNNQYALLPTADMLDRFARRRGLQDVSFTAVGYGLQAINPVYSESERIRMIANPHLVQINVPGMVGDFSLLLSNNHSTGGTCFGDSGGPNFIGNSLVIGGITSFGLNGTCSGGGGVFRVDRKNVLDFINDFIAQ